MSTEKLNTDIRRAQITKATIKVIQKKGLKSLTIASIAKQIGIVPSAIYRHYKSKEQILIAVLELINQNFILNIKKAKENSRDSISILKLLLDNQVKMMLDVSSIFVRILLSDEVFVGSLKLKEKVQSVFNYFLGEIENLIVKGQNENLINKKFSAKSLSVLFMGLFQPSAFLFLFPFLQNILDIYKLLYAF